MAVPLLLHARHRDERVLYQPFGPWVVPWRFDSFEAEYHALRRGVGLIDYSTQALLQVQGADRASFLHSLLTNDIKRLTPGSGCPAALLNVNAKLIAELFVLMEPDALWLLCDATRAADVASTLDRHLFTEAVTLTNHERRQAVLALQGPRTMDALAQLTEAKVALPRIGDHCATVIEDIPLRLARYSLTGDAGVLCLVDAEHAKSAWDLLQRHGAASGLRPVGWEALNTARIEAGIPWFCVDMNEDNLLPETGLEASAVSDAKGCYLGQEIIARLATYGSVSRRLVGLLIDGGQVPEAGDQIVQNDEPVGSVTSACYSPTLQRPIAMGYVKRGAYEPQTAVEILRGKARLAATVVGRPLISL